jgi:hypothetical protein
MNSNASLDRESFQMFLANVFEVRESGLDPKSLSALVEVQRFIRTDEFTVDRALHLITDRALTVSNAAGIAVALLEANQLVYRAGSGLAAMDVGRHVPAVLSVCGRKARVEILRVENAQTDLRIEAEICRQFGATSLLILPIYQAQVVTGVLQVHFSEVHSFLDSEVRTYRVMAGLVEEVILRNLQLGQKEGPTKQSVTVVHSITKKTFQEQAFSEDDDSSAQAVPKPCRSFGEHVATKSTTFGTAAAIRIGQKVNRPSIVNLWHAGATVTAAILLASAIWVVHGHHPAPAMSGSSLSTPNDTGNHESAKSLQLNHKSKRSSDREDAMAPSPAFKRLRIGPNEVDYIAEDVTIRYFTNRPSRPKTRINANEVNIGDDVTVRYFAHKATVSQTRPASTSTQTEKHPSPASQ